MLATATTGVSVTGGPTGETTDRRPVFTFDSGDGFDAGTGYRDDTAVLPPDAHTHMSWAFTDGQHIAISIETRKEVGESYSAVAGFFRQYELYYVVADERDVIRLRTNYRGEQVYLYPLRTPR